MNFTDAERIADAVLYEGYLLYPYRANAAKNQLRWQFGVVAPRDYAEATGSDPWFVETDCLIEPEAAAHVDVRLRYLQIQRRSVEEATADGAFAPVASLQIDGRDTVACDEGVLRVVERTAVALNTLIDAEMWVPLDTAQEQDIATAGAGRMVRHRWPVAAALTLSARRHGRFVILRLRVENTTPWVPDGPERRLRELAMRRSLAGAHALLSIRDGAFVSALDPPSDAADAAAACVHTGLWPVLTGEQGRRDGLLAAPIILYDHPAIAPESPGNLFDGTEIDEILALRIMTLTDDEKQQARATDERAREIVDRTDAMPSGVFERLHGAIRELRPAAPPAEAPPTWEALVNPAGAPLPEDDTVDISGVRVGKGSRVTIRPTRRADAIDLFVRDRVARVEGVYRDLEGATLVAVVVDDDPAGDLHAAYGRFLYYGPEELEPIAAPAVCDAVPGQPGGVA